MKLDLTLEVEATLVDQRTGKQFIKKTKLSDFVKQGTKFLPTFEEATKFANLRKKADENNPVEVTDEEFTKTVEIFKNSETDVKVIFKEMVESQNPKFDLIAYEKETF